VCSPPFFPSFPHSRFTLDSAIRPVGDCVRIFFLCFQFVTLRSYPFFFLVWSAFPLPVSFHVVEIRNCLRFVFCLFFPSFCVSRANFLGFLLKAFIFCLFPFFTSVPQENFFCPPPESFSIFTFHGNGVGFVFLGLRPTASPPVNFDCFPLECLALFVLGTVSDVSFAFWQLELGSPPLAYGFVM